MFLNLLILGLQTMAFCHNKWKSTNLQSTTLPIKGLSLTSYMQSYFKTLFLRPSPLASPSLFIILLLILFMSHPIICIQFDWIYIILSRYCQVVDNSQLSQSYIVFAWPTLKYSNAFWNINICHYCDYA